MTPEKRKMGIDEQIKLMEQTGAYTHSEQHQPPLGTYDRYSGYRNSEQPVPGAGTSPVSPSADPSGRPIVWSNVGGIDTGTTPGRANIHGPSAFPEIPGLNRPAPPQEVGSNLLGSVIPQSQPVLSQNPSGASVVVPAASNPYKVPPEYQQKPGPVYVGRDGEVLNDDDPAYPTLNPINGNKSGLGGVLDAGTTPSQGNRHPPFGSIPPNTPGGKSATPTLDDLRKQLSAQLEKPFVMPDSTQERSYTDPSRISALKSALLQPVPMEHQLAGTLRQTPVNIPQAQTTRYPGDFNQPQPVAMKKPSAMDSDGVQKTFPPGWADANVPKKRVVSPIVESNEGDT